MNIIDSKLNFRNLVYGNNPNKIILHNTASKYATILDVHNWHLANGWAGCGYHFLIRKDGTIYTGRPVTAIGAHCVGQNSTSIGVCFEGDFNNEKMGDKQIEAGKELISFLKNKYGIKNYLEEAGFRDIEIYSNGGKWAMIGQMINLGLFFPVPRKRYKMI
mgnify:CR=1 FL=1